MCAPLPGAAGSSSGAKLARKPERRATSRTTSLSTTLRSAAAIPAAGSTGISNWCAANSAKKRSGCTPASISAPITSPRERLDAALLLQRERERRGASVRSWNSCSKLATQPRAELDLQLVQRVAQEAPRAALPRPAVGLDDVAEHELQRAAVPAVLDAHVRVGVRQQPQVADRAERRRARPAGPAA